MCFWFRCVSSRAAGFSSIVEGRGTNLCGKKRNETGKGRENSVNLLGQRQAVIRTLTKSQVGLSGVHRRGRSSGKAGRWEAGQLKELAAGEKRLFLGGEDVFALKSIVPVLRKAVFQMGRR